MNSVSLYDQLGGAPTVVAAVDLFYKKVLADDELIEFFQGTSMDKLKKHQRDFFTLALGGPNTYTGKDMRKAHEHMKLKDRHFDLILKHLGATLLELGASASQTGTAAGVVESLRNEVLNR